MHQMYWTRQWCVGVYIAKGLDLMWTKICKIQKRRRSTDGECNSFPLLTLGYNFGVLNFQCVKIYSSFGRVKRNCSPQYDRMEGGSSYTCHIIYGFNSVRRVWKRFPPLQFGNVSPVFLIDWGTCVNLCNVIRACAEKAYSLRNKNMSVQNVWWAEVDPGSECNDKVLGVSNTNAR